MAIPRVFLSSTCYDLSEVRDSIGNAVKSFGFDPCLSDHGDVFYHPDLHTHVSCANEIGNCQLFILIIGGRFGGTYVADPSKSIVNAEYAAARELNIPVFTFVKRDVLDDHRFYKKNKDKPGLKDFDFPSIDKQDTAEQIFQFIDDVRLAKVNNGFFAFEFAREIEALLKKQWAGMFFDFLQQRRLADEYQDQRKVLSDLTSATSQLGEIVKTMYRQMDKTHANTVIGAAEDRSKAMQFFKELFAFYKVPGFKCDIETLVKLDTNRPWYEFLVNTKEFYIHPDVFTGSTSRKTDVLTHVDSNRCISVEGDLTSMDNKKFAAFQNTFEAYARLSPKQKKEILDEFTLF